MSTPTALSRIPILRVLFPFAVGILCHRLWHTWWVPLLLLGIAIILYSFLSARSRTPAQRLSYRNIFAIPLVIAAMSLGWLCAVIHCPPKLTDSQRTHPTLAGRVVSLEYTDFSMRMIVDIIDDSLPKCKALLSTRGCNYLMHEGDLVQWEAALEEIGNRGNPGEMDYASFLLESKGIRYHQHLAVGQVRCIGHSPTLLTRMANTHRNLRLMVFNSRLSPPAAHFVTALLLGDGDSIDKATRQEFSAAGVAHVLALSGLHVGIIALVLWWLLFPLDYLRLRKLRFVITLIAIALFAVFTGLPPSVARATAMIGVAFFSLMFHRRALSLNALALAALLILVFSPSAIYSVGFQLSFITVGAILLLTNHVSFPNSSVKWLSPIVSIVITSLVAMMATVALTAHYFHTVSLMSVLANLLILPVLPIFMILGVIFLLVSVAGMEWQLLDSSIDALYRYFHWSTEAVNTIPLSHISGVYVSTFGVIAYFVAMTLFVLWIYRRRYTYLLWTAIVIAALLAHSLWVDYQTPRKGFVIFNSFSSTPILYYDKGMGYVWTPDDEQPDSAAFTRYYAGFLARYNIGELRFINEEDTMMRDDAMMKPPHAFLIGRRILAVGSGRWKHATTTHMMNTDDIIITKRFHGTAAKLKELYRFNRLIISGALHEKTPLLHECDSLGIHVHDLAAQGALVVPPEP